MVGGEWEFSPTVEISERKLTEVVGLPAVASDSSSMRFQTLESSNDGSHKYFLHKSQHPPRPVPENEGIGRPQPAETKPGS